MGECLFVTVCFLVCVCSCLCLSVGKEHGFFFIIKAFWLSYYKKQWDFLKPSLLFNLFKFVVILLNNYWWLHYSLCKWYNLYNNMLHNQKDLCFLICSYFRLRYNCSSFSLHFLNKKPKMKIWIPGREKLLPGKTPVGKILSQISGQYFSGLFKDWDRISPGHFKDCWILPTQRLQL